MAKSPKREAEREEMYKNMKLK